MKFDYESDYRSPLGQWHANLVDRVLSKLIANGCYGLHYGPPFLLTVGFFIVEGLLLEGLLYGGPVIKTDEEHSEDRP